MIFLIFSIPIFSSLQCVSAQLPLNFILMDKLVFENKENYLEQPIPLRIDFDLINLINETDRNECHYLKQNISWVFGNVTCQDFHILSSNKKKVISETLENLRILLEKIIKIHRFEESIQLNWTNGINDYLDIPITKFISQSDLHVDLLLQDHLREPIFLLLQHLQVILILMGDLIKEFYLLTQQEYLMNLKIIQDQIIYFSKFYFMK